jgi:iron complex transport system substrate-binding protein
VRRLPVCTEPKLPLEGDSRAIDDRVRDLVERGLSVYRVDASRLRELAPDLILTQDACEVCAASTKDVEEAVCAWTGASPRVVSVAPSTLGDVVGDVARVAAALGVPERGRALAGSMTERFAEIGERAAGRGARPRVGLIEWIDPLMSAGNWMPELVFLAGGTPLLGEAGAHSPWMAWEELRALEPEAIVILPCGFDIARSRRETPRLEALPGWADTPAARAGRVFVADGHRYFNRPGPRLVDSLEILAEILHPEAFAFGHRGDGYEPL